MSNDKRFKYTDDQLKEVLIEFALNNKGKITPMGLEKGTGIKRHVWMRRMSDEIDKLNKKEVHVSPHSLENLTLPNITDVVETHWNNKTEMIAALQGLNEYINSLWQKAIAHDTLSLEKERLETELSERDEEIVYLKEQVKYFQEQYEKLVVGSTYINIREETGINNVIDMNRKSNKEKSTTVDWDKNFPDLFNDED